MCVSTWGSIEWKMQIENREWKIKKADILSAFLRLSLQTFVSKNTDVHAVRPYGKTPLFGAFFLFSAVFFCKFL